MTYFILILLIIYIWFFKILVLYRKSAKSRRRAERKKARGKKGSIYEEEYLYDSLRRLIERFNNTKGKYKISFF